MRPCTAHADVKVFTYHHHLHVHTRHTLARAIDCALCLEGQDRQGEKAELLLHTPWVSSLPENAEAHEKQDPSSRTRLGAGASKALGRKEYS